MHFSFIRKENRSSFVLLIYLSRVWISAFLGLFALFPLARAVILFELSVYYIRLRTQRPFCVGHTVNTHYHSYILLSWWRKTIYEEIRLSQFFYHLYCYSLKITHAVKTTNQIFQLAFLSVSSTWLYVLGILGRTTMYRPVSLCQQGSSSLPICTYLFHSSFWQFTTSQLS